MDFSSMTATEFQDWFSNEEDCQQALIDLRWPKGFVCPNCGHDDFYFLEKRGLHQCCVCRSQVSITAGTIFHGTKVPLRKWFWILFEVAHDKGGGSSTKLARQLGMYQKTVWHMLQKVRHVMGRRDEGITLAGVIELDEGVLGPEARKTGRRKKKSDEKSDDDDQGGSGSRTRKEKTDVLVMVEVGPGGAGNIALDVIDGASRENIEEVVERKVDPNQSFKTDGFQSHWVLKSMGHFLDLKVCSGPQAIKHLPVVHRAISLLKRNLIGKYHGVSKRYLPRYLQEFAFRFNRRDKESAIFESLLRACIFTVPMTYAESKL